MFLNEGIIGVPTGLEKSVFIKTNVNTFGMKLAVDIVQSGSEQEEWVRWHCPPGIGLITLLRMTEKSK